MRVFSDIIRFEWRYHTRQFSFAAGAAIFAVLGFVLTVGLGRQDVQANSPYLIVEVAALLSLMSIFPLTVFSANAILRDREYTMEEIIFSTAVEKGRFLLGRFSGVVLASLTLMLFAMTGMIAAPLSGVIDPERVGPLIFGHYLQAFAFVVLPDVFFTAAVVFAIAALTRSAPASYVGSVVLYALYFVAAALTNSPLMAASTSNAGVSMSFASLVDPFGLTAFFEQTRYWTIRGARHQDGQLGGELPRQPHFLDIRGPDDSCHHLSRLSFPTDRPIAPPRDEAGRRGRRRGEIVPYL